MKHRLPLEIEQMMTELYTLIGESLVDNQIENRIDFEQAQENIKLLMTRYNVNPFGKDSIRSTLD